jgi:putative component of membrane protein insertase Oxa1/YidC/SpoIIIJ protein YidD
MRWLVLAMIQVYKRYISPYKGFGCAYRIHTGHPSCSTLGYRAIQRYGIWRGWALLRRRTYLCGVAHRRYSPAPVGLSVSPPSAALSSQRGVCDAGCDLPDVSVGTHACDCDWGNSKKKNKEEEQYVHIPPNTRFRDHA